MIAHAETSSFNLTLFDAHVNLLRTQTEAMSAAIAGVNSDKRCWTENPCRSNRYTGLCYGDSR